MLPCSSSESSIISGVSLPRPCSTKTKTRKPADEMAWATRADDGAPELLPQRRDLCAHRPKLAGFGGEALQSLELILPVGNCRHAFVNDT